MGLRRLLGDVADHLVQVDRDEHGDKDHDVDASIALVLNLLVVLDVAPLGLVILNVIGRRSAHHRRSQ